MWYTNKSRTMKLVVDVNFSDWKWWKLSVFWLETFVSIPVATPKQIRELMQVDGLTNDEVKSHLQASSKPYFQCPFVYGTTLKTRLKSWTRALPPFPFFAELCRILSYLHNVSRRVIYDDQTIKQLLLSLIQKYRLHTRRLPASTVAPANQPVVVLGGLLMPQDQYGDSSKACSSQSGSPQGPLQLAGTGGTSTTGGDSMDDDDDLKSESYSWKSRSKKPGNEDA